jgi:hypothetical protein
LPAPGCAYSSVAAVSGLNKNTSHHYRVVVATHTTAQAMALTKHSPRNQ